MKIALITNDFLPKTGGITNVMVNVSEKLTELKEKVYVFNSSRHNQEKLHFKILSKDSNLKGIVKYNIKIYYFLFYLFLKILLNFRGISFKQKLKLVTFYCFYPKLVVMRLVSIKNLVSFFKKNKFEIIISGTANIPLLYSYILSKWFKIPLITIAHGDDFLIRYPLKLKEFIIQDIQKIVVTNEIMKKLFLKIYKTNPNNVRVIHLGVNLENSEVKESIQELRKKHQISPNEFIILSVSRFYPRKGFETVLKAVKLIINEYHNIPIRYLIIGSGEEEKKIRNIIKTLNLDNNVELLGSLDEKLKNEYYKLSNVFVLVPEVKKDSIEGFGIVYIEANYFKLPVIGSRSGGVRIAVENGKSGFLIDPNNVEELKEKILFLYNNKNVCANFGDYGHNRVIKQFNWKDNALKYRELLKTTIREFNIKS